MLWTRSILSSLLAIPVVLGGCATMPPTDGPSLGELEHRGRRYSLRDLNNEAYRDASSDPFVRGFKPDTVWARHDRTPQPLMSSMPREPIGLR